MTVITRNPENLPYGDPSDTLYMIAKMREAGISVLLTESESEHYAVIDRKLVWHGGMNLLGREDAWDNLIRIENIKAAAELVEMSHQNTTSFSQAFASTIFTE